MESPDILMNSGLPVVTAFVLGLLTAISPCPLATNITAIGFISRDIGNRKRIFRNGLLYTLGRIITYTVLGLLVIPILREGASMFAIQKGISQWGEWIISPLLLLTGGFMLWGQRLNLPKFGFSGDNEKLQNLKGGVGSLTLGILFALAFCPTSGVFYFGLLIPMAAISTGGMWFPVVFAVATALPVAVVAWLLAYSIAELGEMTFEEKSSDVEILPKKISKIIESFEDEDALKGIGKNIYEFSYDDKGRIVSLKVTEDGETEPYMSTCTYSSNQLIIKEIGGNKQTETYTLENGKAKHYKKTYPIYEEFDEFAFEYGGDYLSQIKGIIESEYPTTENFIYVGGKLTQYKWIDEEFDNVYALLDFTYDQQLNNLNLDLFGIILADYFENIEDLFLYDITGKRSVYLPEKVKVSGIDDEDGKYEYSVSFKYEVKDNYITKAIIDEDGEKYEYEIFYEN